MDITELILASFSALAYIAIHYLLHRLRLANKANTELFKQVVELKSGNDMAIPQPKFKIGDIVHDRWNNKTFKIENLSYSVGMKHWYYYDGERLKNSNHREEHLTESTNEVIKGNKTVKTERTYSHKKR